MNAAQEVPDTEVVDLIKAHAPQVWGEPHLGRFMPNGLATHRAHIMFEPERFQSMIPQSMDRLISDVGLRHVTQWLIHQGYFLRPHTEGLIVRVDVLCR